MTGKELKGIRLRMGLTQAQFAAGVRMAENSVARMERGVMIVTPPMELLVRYIAREAGVEAPDKPGGGKAAPHLQKAAHATRSTVRRDRPAKAAVPRRRS